MTPLIVTVLLTQNLTGVIGSSSLDDEEQQIAFQERLMLDREAYYQASQY